jgi:hypothetical protein
MNCRRVLARHFVVMVLVLAFPLAGSSQTMGVKSPENITGGTSTTSTPDYTCGNPTVASYVSSHVAECVGCSAGLVSAATACGMSTSCSSCCPKSCSSGCGLTQQEVSQCTTGGGYIWDPSSPSCICVSRDAACKNLGDIDKVGVHSIHPTSQPSTELLNAFSHHGPEVFITDAATLSSVSPCMESIRKRCSAVMPNLDFGFTSYRQPVINLTWRDTLTKAAIDVALASSLSQADRDNFWRAANATVNAITTNTKNVYAAYQNDPKYKKPEYWYLNSIQTYGPNLSGLDHCISSSIQTAGNISMTYAGDTTVAALGGVTASHYAGSAYLYANCAPVEPWKQDILKKANCPQVSFVEFNEFTTPVSLLWSSDTKIEDIRSKSRFPLNPGEEGRWYMWRASGLTPLVVWDPDGKGNIHSPSQLFGNHTFGKSFKNGFEALASLDENKNNWLEGAELKGIALWFDFNQDGISDTGEVKSLDSVGVLSLGVLSSSADSEHGNIYAKQGYTRKTKNGVIEGSSVDWFSGPLKGEYGAEALYAPRGEESKTNEPLQAAILSSPFSGVWDWRMTDPQGDELADNMPHGTLILHGDDTSMKGSSYVSTKLAPNQNGFGELIEYSRIVGNVVQKQDGVAQLKFTAQNQRGNNVETVAQLSPDNRFLAGITTEEQGKDRKPLRYAWVARRN